MTKEKKQFIKYILWINLALGFQNLYFYVLGDMNYDGVVNILDIVLIVGYVLDTLYIIDADLNEDGTLNILDIVIITTLILGV